MVFQKGNFSGFNVLSDEDYDTISLKLIKQKSRGIISDYHFDGENNWSVKARNGVVYNGALDLDGYAVGTAYWNYKDISLRKYYSCPVAIDAESFNLYDEFAEIIKEQELERQKQAEQEEFNRMLEDADKANNIEAMVA